MKKLIIALLLVAMCAAMIGCDPADVITDPTTSAPTQAENPTTAPTEPSTTEPTKTRPPLPGADPTDNTTPSTTATTTATTTASTAPQIQGYFVLGDQMPDFTLTDIYGETVTLYELLAEKQLVMLNFWYMDCYYCKLEFPHINEAYLQYQDQIEILAVNPFDSVAGMKAFRYTHGLEFPVFQDQIGLARSFLVGGFPTTVLIDRYGIVCLIQAGSVPDTEICPERIRILHR